MSGDRSFGCGPNSWGLTPGDGVMHSGLGGLAQKYLKEQVFRDAEMGWALANNLPGNCLRLVETEPRFKREEMVSLGIQVGHWKQLAQPSSPTRQHSQLVASSPVLLGAR